MEMDSVQLQTYALQWHPPASSESRPPPEKYSARKTHNHASVCVSRRWLRLAPAQHPDCPARTCRRASLPVQNLCDPRSERSLKSAGQGPAHRHPVIVEQHGTNPTAGRKTSSRTESVLRHRPTNSSARKTQRNHPHRGVHNQPLLEMIRKDCRPIP